MDFSNIFLFSFYALLIVLFIVIVIPAVYSMFGKKKSVSTVPYNENKVDPARLTVVNSETMNMANLSALTSSGTIEPPKRSKDYTSKVKTQEIKMMPRQPKFEVFNPVQGSNNTPNTPPSSKNWSSNWN